MHQITRYRWLDVLLGVASGAALPLALTVVFAAWYLGHLGGAAPVLWDAYRFWFATLVVSVLAAGSLRDRLPVFAGAMLTGACGLSTLLIVVIWLLDNLVGFSA